MSSVARFRGSSYRAFLLLIAGMGGLLYGVDVGIISAALLFLDKSIHLSEAQTSIVVAAVLGGSMISSVVAGTLADWLGRRFMMVLSGLLFVVSVVVIVISQSFGPLLAGRLLQGMSGGFIAVVVPLYLAECLPAKTRGKGSAIFQLMLTVGIALAAVVGWLYTRQAEIAIHLAAGNAALVLAAQRHAWRGMFLAAIYPGAIFLIGACFLGESPRWLLRQGRKEQAGRELERFESAERAAYELQRMEALALHAKQARASGKRDSLLQRRYVYPFLLTCIILACNQATGINSVLAYLVLILRQAGMSAYHATQGDAAVKLVNVLMTVVAIFLVERKGRKFLLSIGTAGILVSLCAAGLAFHAFEARRSDVVQEVRQHVADGRVALPLRKLSGATGQVSLSVLYSYGSGDHIATVLSTQDDPVLRLAPASGEHGTLRLSHAFLEPLPSANTGWIVAICLAIFIASFAVGPGVVVWLALSELMPTRIRSNGMGIALLINQGVSTAIAGVFLPVVGRFGYFAMFWFWALCTVVYFGVAVFVLPETKGKTLEEIEKAFALPAPSENEKEDDRQQPRAESTKGQS